MAHILIVDDDPLIRIALRETLASISTVLCCANIGAARLGRTAGVALISAGTWVQGKTTRRILPPNQGIRIGRSVN